MDQSEIKALMIAIPVFIIAFIIIWKMHGGLFDAKKEKRRIDEAIRKGHVLNATLLSSKSPYKGGSSISPLGRNRHHVYSRTKVKSGGYYCKFEYTLPNGEKGTFIKTLGGPAKTLTLYYDEDPKKPFAKETYLRPGPKWHQFLQMFTLSFLLALAAYALARPFFY